MYCTLDDIYGSIDEEDVIGYTDDLDVGVVDTDKTDQAIAGAGAVIDSHLGGRYQVPLDPVPEMVRDLAVDIAVYKITGRRSAAPEEWRAKYLDAVRLLEKIGAGKAVIPGAVSAPAGSGSNAVNISSSPRLFGRESMGGF